MFHSLSKRETKFENFKKVEDPENNLGWRKPRWEEMIFRKKVLVLDLLLSFMKLHGTASIEILSNDMRVLLSITSHIYHKF